jgi:hypothetical protein
LKLSIATVGISVALTVLVYAYFQPRMPLDAADTTVILGGFLALTFTLKWLVDTRRRNAEKHKGPPR